MPVNRRLGQVRVAILREHSARRAYFLITYLSPKVGRIVLPRRERVDIGNLLAGRVPRLPEKIIGLKRNR
jgi:hypothetical protein